MALWPVGAALGPIDGLTLRSVLPESLESALRPDTVKRKWKRQCEMQLLMKPHPRRQVKA
jgi:hypothetical protein